MSADQDRTASLMTPAKLAQLKPRPAASPAAWLDQLASDAGHMHVTRLAELSAQLEARTRERDHAPVAAALTRLGEALPQLDYGLLQPRGWLARATGKARSAGAEFAQQAERVAQEVRGLNEQARVVQESEQAEAFATERLLLEFGVECRALEKILDQGGRWLQDMRTQLKSRETQAADDAARRQIEQDTTRCELLVARLKQLRGLASAAQEAHQQAKMAGTRHAAVLERLRQLQSTQLKDWESRVADLTAAAANGTVAASELQAPAKAQRDLQRRAGGMAAECTQLQLEEQALADKLLALRQQLQSAA